MKTRHRITSILVLILCAFANSVSTFGQFNRLFTTELDLPNSLVNKVREDANEMIWIATENGLCRYDGSHFTTYRHEANNPNSIQSDFIRTLCTDDRGHVLIATTAGLQMYRAASDDFTPIIDNPEEGIIAGNVSDLCILSNGDIFASGNTAFTVHFDEYDHPSAVPNPFTTQVFNTFRVCQDLAGDIWVIKFNDGIYRLRYESEHIEANPNVTFTCLGLSNAGTLYAAGLNTGIYRYDKATDSFVTATQEGITFSAREFDRIADSEQMIVATDGNGILNFDCRSGDISPLILDDIRLDARNQKVHSFCTTRNGELWAALYQKGVMVSVNNPLKFHYFGPQSIKYNCVGDRCVTSLLRTHDNRIWVGTDNGGIYCIDDEGRQLKHLDIRNTINGQPAQGQDINSVPSALMRLFEDSRHRVWFGSYGQGGGIVNLETGHCQMLPILGYDGANSNIYDFAEDNRGQIWVASMGMGILRYDEQRNVLIRYNTVTDAVMWSTSLHYDAATDRLFAGTYNGLVTIPLSSTHETEGSPADAQLTLDGYVINSVTPLGSTRLSLCTDHGIVLYNIHTGEHVKYSTEDGLPEGGLYASECDNDGNIWLSGSNGLSKLNIEQGTFTNYTMYDGVKTTEFYKNASMRDPDGTLWFGGTDGITWFHPEEIHLQNRQFSVRVVGLHADRNAILPDSDGTYHISDDDHSFTVDLATRPILQTRRVTYRYSMDGDPWQTLPPTINSVSFSRMASGRHTFRFQAISGEQRSETQSVIIDIDYPWYRSWWATLIWLLLLALVIILLWQFRLEHLRRRKTRQDEAINEAKLQFFMNIAHEFRTPMTLIVSPLQKLISADRDPARQRTYQLMGRNANRILNLINQMMDLRRIDKAQMQLNCQHLALLPLIREQIDLTSDLCQIRNIDMTLTTDIDDTLLIWVDHSHFEKIVLNLLSNALKHTPPNDGKIVVSCQQQAPSSRFPEGYVDIAVTDNGIGIPKEERSHIFERFYQVPSHSNTHSMGTGIGLNLVQSLVHLHHGEIVINDNPDGQGTQFVVSLPLGQSLYSAEECQNADTVATETMTSSGQELVTTASILNGTLSYTPQQETEQKTPTVHHHLLIVDDDEEIRNYLTQELSPHYRITQCADGQTAFDQLMKAANSNSPIDLVLTDLMMPVMDGAQLCQKIRGNVRINHIPIIMLTAKTSDEDRLRSLEIGVNAFVSKPFNIQLLLQTVRNILDNQNRLRNTYSGQQMPTDRVETPSIKSPDERLLDRVLRIVNENLSNPDLTSDMVAREVGLSRVHLYRKLKELTNQSARNYIRNIRLAKAAEMLSQKKMAVSEVAYQVGFSNSNNFATAFKELYGLSPSEYMEQKIVKN